MGRLTALLAVIALSTAAVGSVSECNTDDGSCQSSLDTIIMQTQSKRDSQTRIKRDIDSFNCGHTKEVPFCWWALAIGDLDWKLYHNNMSNLLEDNIKPYCENTDKFHGFSYTNATSVNDSRVLTDVFYFCCSSPSDCSAFTKEKDIGKMTLLANAMLPYLTAAGRKPEGNTTTRCFSGDGSLTMDFPGVEVCIFMADSTSQVKTYAGPMMFNRFDASPGSSNDYDMSTYDSFVDLALHKRLCAPRPREDGEYGTYLKDGQCLSYTSGGKYLLFCCCYTQYEVCSYDMTKRFTPDYLALNRHTWERTPDIRDWVEMRDDQTGSMVSAQPWVFRDFIYSDPEVEHGVEQEPSMSNTPLWHCAHGDMVLKGESERTSSTKKMPRDMLPERTSACSIDITIGLLSNAVHWESEWMSVSYGGTDEQCGDLSCEMREPNCVDDLMDTRLERVNIMVHCCCSTHNLCNHREGGQHSLTVALSKLDLSRVCIGGVYAFFTHAFENGIQDEEIFCLHFIDLGSNTEHVVIPDETVYVPVRKKMQFTNSKISRQYFKSTEYVEFKTLKVIPLPRKSCPTATSRHLMQYGVAYCSNPTSALIKGTFCDQGYHALIGSFATQIRLPVCFGGTYEISSEGIVSDWKIIKTTNSPLCRVEVAVADDDGTTTVTSGLFNTTKYNYGVRLLEKDLTIQTDGTSLYRVVHVCMADVEKPCNGLDIVIRKLLPLVITYHSRRRAIRLNNHQVNIVTKYARRNSVCRGLIKDVKCKTAKGCFVMHSFDGRIPMRGCVDAIPRYVRKDPGLRAILTCTNMLWSKEPYRCAGMRDISGANRRMAVVCCCRHKCPAPVGLSPTSEKAGFQRFSFIS